VFFTFSREFTKGQVSGTRYIEDEMLALITACQEYEAARKDRVNGEKELRKQIAAEFEALVTAKNSAFSMVNLQESMRVQLDRVIALNKVGSADYDEVKDKLDDYREIQLDAIDAMKDYNELLSNFDRLTCGAVTALMQGAELDTDAGEGGLSLPSERAHYYIYNDVADMTFVFGLDVPQDFEPEVTHFEIWYEGVQIGERTSIDRQLRHLTLTYGESDMLTVRVFNEDDFVAECVIDTTTPRDVLPIESGELDSDGEAVERTIGGYSISTTVTGNISVSRLEVDFNPSVGAAFYRIVYGENDVYDNEPIPVDQSFTYLSLLVASLADVKIIVYDGERNQIHEAWFETSDQSIRTSES
jgi:hypothetical protein